jgi:hypothetical protein
LENYKICGVYTKTPPYSNEIGLINPENGYKICKKLHVIVKMTLHAALTNYPMPSISRPQRYYYP